MRNSFNQCLRFIWKSNSFVVFSQKPAVNPSTVPLCKIYPRLKKYGFIARVLLFYGSHWGNSRKLIHKVSILDVHYIWIKTKNDDKKGLLDCVNFKAESVTVASKLGSWIGTKSATRYHFSYLPPFKWWLVSGFGCRRFLAKNRCENSFSLYASRGVISIVVDDFTFFCQSYFLNIHFCHSVLKIFLKYVSSNLIHDIHLPLEFQ